LAAFPATADCDRMDRSGALQSMEKKRTDDARPDYLQRSKQALKDQAAEVVSAASRIAGQAQEAAAAKGAEIWDDAREKVRAGRQDEHTKAMRMIPKVRLPSKDPVFGKKGPLKKLWKSAR
jgi:hypothetical protein